MEVSSTFAKICKYLPCHAHILAETVVFTQ